MWLLESPTKACTQPSDKLKRLQYISANLYCFTCFKGIDSNMDSFITSVVMTYMPQDFRGTLIRQQRERSERNKQAEVDALINSGGSIRDRYSLLWHQQMERRRQLAQLGSATGVYKTLVKYLIGVPQVLLDFVQKINDDDGPMEEQRQRYGPPLYSLTKMVLNIRLFLSLLWRRFEAGKLSRNQITVLEEAVDVYTSEFQRFIKFIRNRKTFSLLTIPIIEQRKVRNAISWIIIKLGIPCAPECYLSNQRSFQRKSACGEVECYVAENAAKDEYLKDIDGMDVGHGPNKIPEIDENPPELSCYTTLEKQMTDCLSLLTIWNTKRTFSSRDFLVLELLLLPEANFEESDGWFVWVERGRRVCSQIKLDEENLRWVSEQMQQASCGNGNLYRKWGRKIQNYLYRVYQNFNRYGRYIRIETRKGEGKSTIIILEVGYNKGWGDMAGKILHSLGEALNYKYKKFTNLQKKSFLNAAEITHWPNLQGGKIEKVTSETTDENFLFLSKCLVECFNDPFHRSPNTEIIQKRFTFKWQVTAGLRITPMAHNKFLFEFPSKQEAARVKAGDWFWNVRHLQVEWWSPEFRTSPVGHRADHR
ncbi:putative ethanolamine-phosphate cytidylyltransferase-like [Capsicum annuum]|nr:putative ethanolamine-phosphate cytidylyltransferase-like [Capsicum annuum]